MDVAEDVAAVEADQSPLLVTEADREGIDGFCVTVWVKLNCPLGDNDASGLVESLLAGEIDTESLAL